MLAEPVKLVGKPKWSLESMPKPRRKQNKQVKNSFLAKPKKFDTL